MRNRKGFDMRDAKRVFIIKAGVIVIGAITAAISGFFPDQENPTNTFEFLLEVKKAGAPGILVGVLSVIIFLSFNLMYPVGMVMYQKVVSGWQAKQHRLVPFMEMTWLWFFCLTGLFFHAASTLIYGLTHQAPPYLWQSCGLNMLMVVNGILLNYFLCSRLIDEQWKPYSFGLVVNSWINSLIRRKGHTGK